MFWFWKKKTKKEKTEGSEGGSDALDFGGQAAAGDPGQTADPPHGHSHGADSSPGLSDSGGSHQACSSHSCGGHSCGGGH
jgi:hypothetical protein